MMRERVTGHRLHLLLCLPAAHPTIVILMRVSYAQYWGDRFQGGGLPFYHLFTGCPLNLRLMPSTIKWA
jgi:hypothetical protein